MLLISISLVLMLILFEFFFKEKDKTKMNKKSLDFNEAREVIFRNRELGIDDKETLKELSNEFIGERYIKSLIAFTPEESVIEKYKSQNSILFGIIITLIAIRVIVSIFSIYHLLVLGEDIYSILRVFIVRLLSILLYIVIGFYVRKVQIEGYRIGFWIFLLSTLGYAFKLHPFQNDSTYLIDGFTSLILTFYFFIMKQNLFYEGSRILKRLG